MECGNFRLNDLKGAKELCDRYSNFLLREATYINLVYPE